MKDLFDISKIPSKVFAALFLIGLFLFRAPQQYSKIVINYEDTLTRYAYVIFLFSFAMLLLNIIIWMIGKVRRFFITMEIKRDYKRTIQEFSPEEKGLIGQFYINKTHILPLAHNHPTVQGLVDKKVLFPADSIFGGGTFINGFTVNYKLNNYMRKVIQPVRDLNLIAKE